MASRALCEFNSAQILHNPAPPQDVKCEYRALPLKSHTPSPPSLFFSLLIPSVVNPDIIKDLANRGEAIKETQDLERRGTAWLSSHHKHVPKDVSKIGIYSSYERKYT